MMLESISPIPLSLYVHIPWCIRKCPYCDFNSHKSPDTLPEIHYIDRLLENLDSYLDLVQNRPIESIFIGGGTPSLFSAEAYQRLFKGLNQKLTLKSGLEITLEANPGTFEQERFKAYQDLGINRLSIGIQSLQDTKLKALGRIHGAEEALKAIDMARESGFENFNLDLMYGLPNQSIDDALYDLETALAKDPTHLSWYHLTLEPNTLFHKFPPALPKDELIWEMQEQGHQLLKSKGYNRYEISAFSKKNRESQHNLNYWNFGDYIGIGAGAHGKLTDSRNKKIIRTTEAKNPKDYLGLDSASLSTEVIVAEKEIPLEFMMNSFRLEKSIPLQLFFERTGLPLGSIKNTLERAEENDYLKVVDNEIILSPKGRLFLNDVLELFLV